VSGATDYERSGERLEGERKGELRVSGARIGSGCKHKMGITDHHREVFICLRERERYMSDV